MTCDGGYGRGGGGRTRRGRGAGREGTEGVGELEEDGTEEGKGASDAREAGMSSILRRTGARLDSKAGVSGERETRAYAAEQSVKCTVLGSRRAPARGYVYVLIT